MRKGKKTKVNGGDQRKRNIKVKNGKPATSRGRARRSGMDWIWEPNRGITRKYESGGDEQTTMDENANVAEKGNGNINIWRGRA